jgi:hypothetical protein
MHDLIHGWQRDWWRLCARFWAARYRRAVRHAACFADYERAVAFKRRSEKFFQRVKGAAE